jgi:hypothetical protein
MDDDNPQARVPETLRPVAHEGAHEGAREGEPEAGPGEPRLENFMERRAIGLPLAMAGMLALVVGLVVWVMKPLTPTEFPSVATMGAPMNPSLAAAQPATAPAPTSESSASSASGGGQEANLGTEGEPDRTREATALIKAAALTCLGVEAPGATVTAKLHVTATGRVTSARVRSGSAHRAQSACMSQELVGARLPVASEAPRSLELRVQIPTPEP